MNTYLVNLDLIIGEFEKSSIQLIDAGTARMAGQRAIENECHDKPEWTDKEKDECWDCGQMVYRVHSITKIDKADANVLKRYMHY
jgi:hypothetical protein